MKGIHLIVLSDFLLIISLVWHLLPSVFALFYSVENKPNQRGLCSHHRFFFSFLLAFVFLYSPGNKQQRDLQTHLDPHIINKILTISWTQVHGFLRGFNFLSRFNSSSFITPTPSSSPPPFRCIRYNKHTHSPRSSLTHAHGCIGPRNVNIPRPHAPHSHMQTGTSQIMTVPEQ